MFKGLFSSPRPLSVSILVTTVELLLYALLILLDVRFTTTSQDITLSDYLSKLILNYSNIILTIVTTWYVIFTYYLLKAAEYPKNVAEQPLLAVSFKAIDHKSEYFAREAAKLSETYKRKLLEEMGFKVIEPAEANRYINVCLKNLHKAIPAKIKMKLRISVKFNTTEIQDIFWEIDTLQLQENEVKEITVFDSYFIPGNAKINITIVEFQYSDELNRYSIKNIEGNSEFSLEGQCKYQTDIPKPALQS
jgi:hypothetical protein